MKTMKQRRNERIANEYQTVCEMVGREQVAWAIGAERGDWDAAVNLLAVEWEFDREQMEDIRGRYWDSRY